jgi:hypothetical protein
MNYMETQHQNNTCIDRKQCSLASSRGKPPAEKSSIIIILEKKILIPSIPIYTKPIYHKRNIEEDLLEVDASMRGTTIFP